MHCALGTVTVDGSRSETDSLLRLQNKKSWSMTAVGEKG